MRIKNTFMLDISRILMSAHRSQNQKKGKFSAIDKTILEGDITYEQYEEID